MSEAAERQTGQNIFPARVVSVLNDYQIVINRGSEEGIKSRDKFLLYEIGAEMFDPETGESLGKLEIPKGSGQVAHLQEHMTTIKSDRKQPDSRKRIVKYNNSVFGRSPFPNSSEEEEIVPSNKTKPFDEPAVGDYVKPV